MNAQRVEHRCALSPGEGHAAPLTCPPGEGRPGRGARGRGLALSLHHVRQENPELSPISWRAVLPRFPAGGVGTAVLVLVFVPSSLAACPRPSHLCVHRRPVQTPSAPGASVLPAPSRLRAGPRPGTRGSGPGPRSRTSGHCGRWAGAEVTDPAVQGGRAPGSRRGWRKLGRGLPPGSPTERQRTPLPCGVPSQPPDALAAPTGTPGPAWLTSGPRTPLGSCVDVQAGGTEVRVPHPSPRSPAARAGSLAALSFGVFVQKRGEAQASPLRPRHPPLAGARGLSTSCRASAQGRPLLPATSPGGTPAPGSSVPPPEQPLHRPPGGSGSGQGP